MNRPKDMETEFFTLMASLLLEKDNDTPFRLSEQEDALKSLECSKPELGRWVRDCDFPFLMETLMLEESVFAQEFPGAKLTFEDRKELSNALELHCETCNYCHRKRAYDLEWQSRVSKVFAENKQTIGQAIARARSKK
jgi:hypothetical protein